MPDNTSGIFKSYWDMARISQEGGGIGWYVGKVRPGDAYSPKVPKANVITKWIKIINDIAVAVNQRGIRNGAITPAIDWWHLDCEVFTEIKSELNGDLRDKCFDIFPQVIVDNYFLKRVKAKEDVYQYDQYEFKQLTGIDITELIGEKIEEAHTLAAILIEEGKLKHFHKVKAGYLWGKMLKAWIEYGDFYISNKDNINISNYLSEFGIAHCVNLCLTGDTLVDILVDNKEIRTTLKEVQTYFDKSEVKIKSKNIDTDEIEYKKITDWMLTAKDAELLEIEDEETGKIIRCTPNHKIYTKNRGYVEAKDLLETDILDIV
jgi:ribonucleotide reductase alpha subunit